MEMNWGVQFLAGPADFKEMRAPGMRALSIRQPYAEMILRGPPDSRPSSTAPGLPRSFAAKVRQIRPGESAHQP